MRKKKAAPKKKRETRLFRVVCTHHRRPQVLHVLPKYLPLTCGCGHRMEVLGKVYK